MSTIHPYSVSVEGRHPNENGYRWTIAGSPSGTFSSQEIYATRREALAAGENTALRLARMGEKQKLAATLSGLNEGNV